MYLSDDMLRHEQRGRTDAEREAMASPQMASKPTPKTSISEVLHFLHNTDLRS